MGEVHHLPDVGRDDRRLIDVTVDEFIDRLRERGLVSDGNGKTDESLVSAKQFGKLVSFGETRIRHWCREGCEHCGEKLPHVMQGDVKGILICPYKGRAWIEAHRGPEGCRG